MPASRAIGKAHLLRPLLNESREQLERYAAAHNVPVLEDPSNQSEQFDRNFLRLKVLPLMRERWPALDNSFADVAALQAEADTLHRDLASMDAKACDLRDEPLGFSICESGFKRLSGARRNNMLRGLCAGNGLPLPPRKRLQTLMQQLDASADRQPAVEWPGAKALRWGGRLYLLGDLPESPSARWYSLAEAAEGALGAVLCRISTGEAGYRIGVRALSSSKRLKNRFQELGIPPWLRDYYPLLYKDDALLAIGANWLPGQPPLFTIDIEWRAIEQT
jgi:tRNA(Ile)-lysidine synthase